MKPRTQLSLAFFAGAVVATMVTATVTLHWKQQQDQMMWTAMLNRELVLAARLDPATPATTDADVLERLPRMVRSVDSFGRNSQTVPVLRAARSFYLRTGRTIPSEIQPILSSL